VGAIALRTGMPPGEDPWAWSCGFYPGSHSGECTDGTAATFDLARADFEAASQVFLSRRTAADFQAWRDQRDWTAEKYRRFDRHERMPPAAMEALILVATSGGPTMFARIGIMRALNRGYVREFNPSRKDPHWGRRKLKRDM
jgi:hypothetical protein